MQNTIHTRNNQPAGELAWRLILIGVMALLMCSCRAPGMFKSSTRIEPARPATAAGEIPRQQDNKPVVFSISSNPPVTNLPGVMQQVAYQQPVPPPTTLPRSAYTGEPPAGVDIPHLNSGGIPYPDNWRPPGIPGPWPADEYLLQGGDREQTVNVGKDWSIDNLDSEDAIVHYHTLEGKLVVQPTNRLPIYAPRFGSVRRMDGIDQLEIQKKLASADWPTKLDYRNSSRIPGGVLQQLQPQHNLAMRSSSSYRERNQGLALYKKDSLLQDDGISHLEKNRTRDQSLETLNTEKPRFNEMIVKAQSDLIKQRVQMTMDGVLANENRGTSSQVTVHAYHSPEGSRGRGKGMLKITKTSSSQTARPGEMIEFTIHFKNIGPQDVGNVTIVDHLTSRLDYVEESQESSLGADFFVQQSVQEGTTVLRWEIIDPLGTGESGQVTFRCQVR